MAEFGFRSEKRLSKESDSLDTNVSDFNQLDKNKATNNFSRIIELSCFIEMLLSFWDVAPFC